MVVGNGFSKENGNSVKPSETSPLLPVGNVQVRPLSSSYKTFFNIVITVVGAGVLGLPYAFKQSGWLQGLLILAGTSAAMYYCMMLMVWCRRHLETEGIVDNIDTYSELGYHTLGKFGQISVDAMIVLSQGGFCVAYLIFIGENLASVFSRQKAHSLGLSGALENFQGLDFMGLSWKTKEVYVWILFPFQVSSFAGSCSTSDILIYDYSFHSGGTLCHIPNSHRVTRAGVTGVHPLAHTSGALQYVCGHSERGSHVSGHDNRVRRHRHRPRGARCGFYRVEEFALFNRSGHLCRRRHQPGASSGI